MPKWAHLQWCAHYFFYLFFCNHASYILEKFSDFWYNENMKLTEAAVVKVAELIKDAQITIPTHNLFLRVAVHPGGCSGLRYQTYFDYEIKEGDNLVKHKDFDLRVDKMSYPYLDGATMDFVNTIEKQGFTIDNPNAQGGCACGESFN